MIKKIPTSQDCYYKWAPKNSGETSINLSKDIVSYILPTAVSGNDHPITFTLYKDDYLKAIGYLMNIMPLYTSTSKSSSQVNYDPNYFKNLYSQVESFFGNNNSARYSVNLKYREDGRIYLNQLDYNGFNVRNFLVEFFSEIIFDHAKDGIVLRILVGPIGSNAKQLTSEERKEAFFQYIELKKNGKTVPNYKEAISNPKRGTVIYNNMMLLDMPGMLYDYTDVSRIHILYQKVVSDPDNAIWNQTCSAAVACYRDFLLSFYENPQDNKIVSVTEGSAKPLSDPLQQIYYGAPGTGKSFTVDGICKKYEHIRTTFHPDSDYSTFVGCYKPIKEKVEKTIADTGNMDKDTLSIILQDRINNIGKQNQCDVLALFGYEYSESLSKLDKGDVKALVGAALKKQPGVSFSDNVYVGVGESLYEKYGKTSAKADSKITYSYSPQAFIKAYVKAWKMHENNIPVFLIIEEINRGNCAQIFGDLFQLLDRNALGYSSYEITPDDDLKNYIAEQGIQVSGVVNSNNEDISKKIESGELLKLPRNLYIWATMNTSDQSLFPIDSAFKRRWDWKFVKITEGYEKDENGKPVMITGEDGKETKKKLGWQIKLSDEKTQDWWKFIQKVNEIIASMTSSADKQLGYFFCKPDLDKTTISAETFVSKVIFYLWNDVFKDFGFEDASLFRYKVNDKEEKDLTFPDFYDEDGEMVDTTRLTDFVDKVMNWKKTKEDND